jgi:hypothetical protein
MSTCFSHLSRIKEDKLRNAFEPNVHQYQAARESYFLLSFHLQLISPIPVRNRLRAKSEERRENTSYYDIYSIQGKIYKTSRMSESASSGSQSNSSGGEILVSPVSILPAR